MLFCRIKTNTTGAEFLYLPLEIEVTSQPGIFCPQVCLFLNVTSRPAIFCLQVCLFLNIQMLPPDQAFFVYRLVFFIYIQMLPPSPAFSVFRFIFFIYTNFTSRPSIFCLQVCLFFYIYKCYLRARHSLSSGLSFFYIQMLPPSPVLSVLRFVFF